MLYLYIPPYSLYGYRSICYPFLFQYEVASTKTQHKCKLKYHPYSYFSREQPRRVTGTVHNDAGKPVQAVQGTWDESISLYDITKYKDPSNMETTNERLLWEKVECPTLLYIGV